MARTQKRKTQQPVTEIPESTPSIDGKFLPGQVVEHRASQGLKLVIVSGPRMSRMNNIQYLIKTPMGSEIPVLEANLF
ncbi:MAG: hypothetical protein HPY50_17695 [Firmicutes bacterium]|nr:hypothetical protein [Bacillota bacterium]